MRWLHGDPYSVKSYTFHEQRSGHWWLACVASDVRCHGVRSTLNRSV